MKKEKIINIIAGILYYALGIIFFRQLFLITLILPMEIIVSKILYLILYLILPLFLLILPIIICKKEKKVFYKSILLSLIGIVIYLIMMIVIRVSMTYYFGNFTPEKWRKYPELRGYMFDDLEKNHKIIGMSKDDAINLLGKPEETDKGICYYDSTFVYSDYYFCLLYDENNIITEANSYNKWNLKFNKD